MASEREEGRWPKLSPQAAFVTGAKWWEFAKTGGTMWASDVDRAEAEAVRRYGEPPPAPRFTEEEMAGIVALARFGASVLDPARFHRLTQGEVEKIAALYGVQLGGYSTPAVTAARAALAREAGT